MNMNLSGLILIAICVPLVITGVVYLLIPVARGLGWTVRHIARYIGHTLGDALRFIGAVVTLVVFAFLALGNVVVGRWSAAQHFGRAVQGEIAAAGACLYRIGIGHPLRLFYLHGLVEGVEKRVPAAMAAAPGPTAGGVDMATTNRPEPVVPGLPRTSRARAAQFEGYEIVGTLAGGGSGGKLYIARPDAVKLASLSRQGFGEVGDVVIKSFSVREGSSLPQIVRENRALEAAKKLGLVLEHELTPDRFFYVMRYVPGDSLALVTQRLHAGSPAAGLGLPELERVVSYACDLAATLDQYHRAGLWHKDIKPDNIIVHAGDGRAHLVDFGLVTPLRSSMTLTTHGTEYFRDPELVRLALRGVKVHEVDGAKFDIYGAGAVLYSMVENSFPAHGALSQLTRSAPETLKWVIRRAMTDYDRRYPSAASMLADLQTVLIACRSGGDAILALRPADLPSVRDGGGQGVDAAASLAQAAAAAAVPPTPPPTPFSPPAYAPPPIAPPPMPAPGQFAGMGAVARAGGNGVWNITAAGATPAIAGGIAGAFGGGRAASPAVASFAPSYVPPIPRRGPSGVSAAEQVRRARARVAERRTRAQERMQSRRASALAGAGGAQRVDIRPNAGVIAGVVLLGVVVAMFLTLSQRSSRVHVGVPDAANVSMSQPGIPDLLVEVAVAADDAAAAAREAVGNIASVSGGTPKPSPASGSRRNTRDRSARTTPPVERVSDVGVLVLREGGAMDEPLNEAVEARVTALRDRGFSMVDVSQDSSDNEGATALAAEARRALGLAPLKSADGTTSLQNWLRTLVKTANPLKIQMVLWIAPHPESTGRAVVWLVPAPGCDSSVTRAAAAALDRLDSQPKH